MSGRLRFSFRENAKIPQLDLFATGNSFSDVVKGSLNDVEDLLLHQPRLIADANYEVSFGHSILGIHYPQNLHNLSFISL